MFFSNGLGASIGTPAQCYDYFSGYGIDPGYYAAGPPSYDLFTFTGFPFLAVIDLNTGVLVGKDYAPSEADYLSESELVALVQAANGE